jgi:hypothetical protein
MSALDELSRSLRLSIHRISSCLGLKAKGSMPLSTIDDAKRGLEERKYRKPCAKILES